MSCDVAALKTGLGKIAKAMENCKDELNSQDGELGDGDLGITMSRGMRTVILELDNLPQQDVGMSLFACAKCFTKVSGSSYGTLLATGLMAAAKLTKGKSGFAWAQLGDILTAAREAMQQRGKAKPGEKTVLDTLAAVSDSISGVEDPALLAQKAREGANQALADFKGKPSQVGRARMYKEKSQGMDDPGMLAMTRVIESL